MTADPAGSLAELRRHIASLVAQIDVGEMPPPDRVRTTDGLRKGRTDPAMPPLGPGAEWKPAHGIRVFTIDDEDGADAVYMAQEQFGYCMPNDWESFRPDDARRLAMSLLAAAEWVEQHRARIPRLDRRRTRTAST